jgi:hypothetical protein
LAWEQQVAKVFLGSLVLTLLSSGCAVLHHCQVGEIDAREPEQMLSFEIKVSETGVNIEEAGDIARGVARNNPKAQKQLDQVQAIVGMFQMGPRTGNPVYSDQFARNLGEMIRDKCKSGRVTGLTSIREMRKYPVISGEIVKVRGYCIAGEAEAKEKPAAKKKGKA